MAISTINIGSSANKGDGDPLRSAFTKINNNFTDVNTRLVALEDGSISTSVIGDLKGSVFADDSTLLVDGVNGVIPKANIESSTNWDTAFSWGNHSTVGYLTSETSHADVLVDGDFATAGFMKTDGAGTYSIETDNSANWDTAFLWGDHSTAGYAPQTTTYTKTEVDSAISAVNTLDGDFTGSVFGDDSTLLVDGVAGKIVGPVDTASITQSDTGSFTSNFTTTITQDNEYTKFTKVDVFDDGEFVSTTNREIKLGANSLLFDSTVGANNAIIRNDSVGGQLDLIAGTGIASEGNADGGDLVLTSGQPGVGGDGGNIILNSNADIFIGPLANTLDIRIGGGPGYAAENNTFFYGNVNIDSGKKLDTDSVTNSSGNLTLDSTSGAVIIGTNATQTIINGDVDFGNSGTIDFTGATVTGLNHDITGSVFADDSTLLVDGVNGKLVGDYENGTSTIGISMVRSYDVVALQDLNTLDSYVNGTLYGGATANIKNLAIGSFAPSTSNGASGDRSGMIAFDSTYIYYCTANYTDGVADIWKRVAWSGDTW